MQKKFQKSLFIFRRDLRLEDNTGLIFSLQNSQTVIPIFIFTPEQIEKNPYRSDHCLKFMLEALEDLDRQLKRKKGKLIFFRGKPEKIVEMCIHRLGVKAVVVNRDYTPYSQKRDQKIKNACKKQNVAFFAFEDALLHAPEETLKDDGTPYKIFTPYFHNASRLKIRPPMRNVNKNYFRGSIPFSENTTLLGKILLKTNLKNTLIGGRSAALKILKTLDGFSKYPQFRDFPAADYSTHLSPYLKFTVVSPREVYTAICKKLNSHHELVRSLYWRDFFTSIAFFFPHVFKGSFHTHFDRLKWSNDRNAFQRWCKGATGFPIVDAGMREMNATGFMHNRVRMIVASFLTKDLHMPWRWGEKYFAQKLIDYDPAVNNGNWQWVASTGCDAQPYFRIFNPWTQQKKFDSKCVYIKKWIPELKDLPTKVIHAWYSEKYHSACPQYSPPIIQHEKEAKYTLKSYRSVF